MSLTIAALIISIFSVLVASLSLGWNIYRDVVIKPKVGVLFGVRILVSEKSPNRKEYIVITATNFGPGSTTVSTICINNTSFINRLLKKSKYAIVMHDYENPLSGQLPAKLEVGEKIDILLPYNKNCFLKEEWSNIGLNDYFGTVHWANKKQLIEARKNWLAKYSSELASE
jgi:hypothetical protein